MNMCRYQNRLSRILNAVMVCIFLLCPVHAQNEQDAMVWPQLQTEHKPACRWWWPGSAVDSVNISRILQTMHDAGIGGVTVSYSYSGTKIR